MQVGAKPKNEHKDIQNNEAARLTGLHVDCYMRAKNEESINLATIVVLWTNNCITIYSQVRKGNQCYARIGVINSLAWRTQLPKLSKYVLHLTRSHWHRLG